jgi:hypothetical protein
MIHDPVAVAAGNAHEMRVMAGVLDRAKNAMASIYSTKSERSVDEISQLMADETWMSAQEAFDLGFADRIDPAVPITARFDLAKLTAKHPSAATAALFKEISMSSSFALDPASDPEPPASPAAEPETAKVLPDSEPTEELAEEPVDADVAPADAPGEPALTVAAVARQGALAYAREAAELRALAGFADRAAKFITAETSVEQVRAALLEARASADARLAVDGTCTPRAGQMPASKDAGWGDAIARVCKP